MSKHEQILRNLSDKLEALDFVKWDRWVGAEWSDDLDYVTVYGWIDRSDGHADFVEIIRWEGGNMYFTTSSAEHTERIHKVLFESGTENHNDCCRVENVLEITNMVELDGND